MIIPDFIIPFVVLLIIQFIKIIIDVISEKRISLENTWRAGWFPSVHSGISSSLITLFFLKYWFYSAEFSIALIFGMLFWYDAMNVRYEAWKHAQEINKLKLSLNVKDKELNLTERLGHTIYEVIWGIVIWAALTIGIYYLLLVK